MRNSTVGFFQARWVQVIKVVVSYSCAAERTWSCCSQAKVMLMIIACCIDQWFSTVVHLEFVVVHREFH